MDTYIRKLASIQRIISVEPIENADSIEKVTVLGWHCVSRKGEFKPGDLCVYCEVDSVMPDKPEFEFLKPRGMRIKTIKLRGQVSQGICFPLSILPDTTLSVEFPMGEYFENQDVTNIINVTKWEPKMPAHLAGLTKGWLPSIFPRTDEIRLQSVPEVLVRNIDKLVYITEKLDGTSISVWKHDGEFNVGSRRLSLKETEDNIYWNTAKNLGLADKLPDDLCIQGELIGPQIQKNKYQLKDYEIYWFNAYSIKEQRYLKYLEFVDLIVDLGLKMVPLIHSTYRIQGTVDEWVELSKGKSQLANIQREGIVARTVNELTDYELGRFSFKVINPDFLLKWDE